MNPDDSDDVDDVPYSVVGIVFEPVADGDVHFTPARSPEDSADFVASVLARHGLVAGLLDGAVVGAPGWILAQTLEFDDGSIARWTIPGSAARHFERVGVYDLRKALESETGRRVQIGMTLTLPSGVFEAGDFRGLTGDWVAAQTIVGRWTASDAPVMANTLDEPLWFANLPRTATEMESDKKELPYAALAPAGPPGFAIYGIAAWPSKSPVLSFSRNGPWRGLSVFARNGVLHSVNWGPVWKVVDPSGHSLGAQGQQDLLVQEALEELSIGRDGDPADMAMLLISRKRLWRTTPATLDGERLIRLRRALRNRLASDPFGEVAAALGVPLSVVDIAEGKVHLRELPGARYHDVEGLMRAAWKSAVMETDKPGFTNWLYRTWAYRPWHYWAYSILFGPGLIAVAAVELNNHNSSWPLWLLWTAVGLGTLEIADMLVPRKWRTLDAAGSAS